MNIIPQNGGIAQVGIHSETDKMQTSLHTNEVLMNGIHPSVLQEQAFTLYDYGLNIFPQPFGKKGGYPWKRLQYTRLPREHEAFGLQQLFLGECNLAVMCGATSGNLFVIDCETEEALRHHARQMRQRDIPLWVVKTARGGHIYLRTCDGEVHNVEPNVMRDVEIKGQRGYVLAPPSIHPSGAIYEWLVQEGTSIPVVKISQIDWLRDCNDEAITLKATPPPVRNRGNWISEIPSPHRNLSNATQNYLKNGHSVLEGNRNNELFKAACDLAGNHFSENDAMSTLLEQAISSGLSERESRATIRSAYSQPRTPARPSNTFSPTIDEAWRYALLYGIEYDWIGRTRNTDRAVYLALVERARLASNENDVFRGSVRELSELARMGCNTVQRALKRLIATNLILGCGNDRNSGGRLWRFTDVVIDVGKQLALNMDTVSFPPQWLSYSVSLFNSDITERGALGHGVLFIYEHMCRLKAPMMPSALAQAISATVNQVNYALKKLRSFGLAQRLKEGWQITSLSLDELEVHIAQFVDVDGKGAAREQRHERERQIFAARILFFARARCEGSAFRQWWQWFNGVPERFIAWCGQQIEQNRQELQELLDDPLVQLGLELGGEVDLGGGRYLKRRMILHE